MLLTALRAAVQMSAHGLGATGADVLYGPFVAWQQPVLVLRKIFGAMQAEDVCQLRHVLQICHEPVDDFRGRLECRFGQLGVDHGGLWIGMAQYLLDDAQIHTMFEQMCGVGMPQGMDGCLFMDTGFGQGFLEGDLDTGCGQRFIGV
jgi:hypothetical protein